MNIPLLAGPMAVVDAIERYRLSHNGRNPTRKEFGDIFFGLGMERDVIDDYINIAIKADIVMHDKATDFLFKK